MKEKKLNILNNILIFVERALCVWRGMARWRTGRKEWHDAIDDTMCVCVFALLGHFGFRVYCFIYRHIMRRQTQHQSRIRIFKCHLCGSCCDPSCLRSLYEKIEMEKKCCCCQATNFELTMHTRRPLNRLNRQLSHISNVLFFFSRVSGSVDAFTYSSTHRAWVRYDMWWE